MSTETVTISREEYETLLKANEELAQQVNDHHGWKCEGARNAGDGILNTDE